ncbi:hypothetical protein JQ580_33425 [Bradyrhizobium japonicum]|uniref:hypothetical protein n=1 Tax=Bradyrhizobium japonicum TaxID=375 RepID=UPI001BAD792E|nr:hypothetical protein [Bradyrhizobium japonicum]MBR0995617.1 hypothetical protein [Bradyrhizobium japonicum]
MSRRVVPIRRDINVMTPPKEPPAPGFNPGIEGLILLASMLLALTGLVSLLVKGFRWFEPIAKESPMIVSGAAILLGLAGAWFAGMIAKRKAIVATDADGRVQP